MPIQITKNRTYNLTSVKEVILTITKAEIRKRIKNRKAWRIRALLVLYWYSINWEANQDIVKQPGVGLNSYDLKSLKPIAESVMRRLREKAVKAPQLLRKMHLVKTNQDIKLYNKLPKYSAQLEKIANGTIKPIAILKDKRYKL
jgi:hypothetical protein